MNEKIIVAICTSNSTVPDYALDLESEQKQIVNRLDASSHGHHVEVLTIPAATPDDLLQMFNKSQPNVLHFSGHGSKTGIVLKDEIGNPHEIKGSALAALCKVMGNRLQVVVLNVCYSANQIAEIVKHVDVVISVEDTIDDNAAITFSAGFYRAVGFGRSIENAYEQGKVAIQLAGSSDWKLMRLDVRDGIDPADILLIQPHATSTVTPSLQMDVDVNQTHEVDCRHCHGTGKCINGRLDHSCATCLQAENLSAVGLYKVVCSVCSGTGGKK